MFCAISSQWNDRINNLPAKGIESPDTNIGTATFKDLHMTTLYILHTEWGTSSCYSCWYYSCWYWKYYNDYQIITQ